jgi:hypothetical protein
MLRPSRPDADGCFLAWFAFCTLLGLFVVGVIVWAVISIVNHVTG